MNFARGLSVRPGFWLAASGMIAVSMAAPVKAQNTAGQIQLELSNTPLTSAVELLTQRSGAKIVVADPQGLAGKTVTVSLNGMTVEKALNTILTATKTHWYKGDDGVFYINADPPVAPVVAEAPAPARIVTTEKLELRNQSPSMMMRALGMDSTFPLEPSIIPPATPWSTAPGGAMIRPVGSGGDGRTLDVNGRKWEISNGNAYPIPTSTAVPQAVNPSMSSDQAGRDIEELDSANQLGFPRGRGRGTGTTTNQPGGIGGPGAPNTGTGAGGANAQNQNRLIPDGIDTIFPYQEDNSLLVRGEPDAIDELKNIIALLDVPVRQVSIKAEFVTVTDSDINAFGLNWSTNLLNSSVTTDIGGTGTTSGPTITIGIAQGNINATLTALRQRGRARTIQAPLISTLNNVPAWITTQQSYPIFTPNILQGGVGGGGNIVTYQPTYVTASTGLQVTPRINRDGTVTVQIAPQVSAFNGFVQGPNNQSLPVIVQQQLFTNRRVRSGESIVLGGLATKDYSQTTRGIPFLEDLPFIGRLFRSTNDTANDSQLLIFLTPTIVEETSGAQVSPS